MVRQRIGFLQVNLFPYLVLKDDAQDYQMFNAAPVDIERYVRAEQALLAAEEELLEGIEPEIKELLSKKQPPLHDRVAHQRYTRARQLKERLQALRKRGD